MSDSYNLLTLRWHIHQRHVEKTHENFARVQTVFNEYKKKIDEKRKAAEFIELLDTVNIRKLELDELSEQLFKKFEGDVNPNHPEIIAATARFNDARLAFETPDYLQDEAFLKTLDSELFNAREALLLTERELANFERSIIGMTEALYNPKPDRTQQKTPFKIPPQENAGRTEKTDEQT